MKIIGLVGSHSDDRQTALKTDPPLTDEILESAITNYLGADKTTEFWNHNGLFVVGRIHIPQIQVELYAEALTGAEKLIENKITRTEVARNRDLQDRADTAGLPLLE